MNPQVDRLRYHHESQQPKRMLLNRPPQNFAEQAANPVFDKQWQTPIARERQLMHMPRLVMTNLYSARLTCVLRDVYPEIAPRKTLLGKPAVAPGKNSPSRRAACFDCTVSRPQSTLRR
jgi:hypothetical protein